MPLRPSSSTTLRLSLIGLAVALVAAIPPLRWELGLSIASVEIAFAIDTGTVRIRTDLSDIGQGTGVEASRLVSEPAA